MYNYKFILQLASSTVKKKKKTSKEAIIHLLNGKIKILHLVIIFPLKDLLPNWAKKQTKQKNRINIVGEGHGANNFTYYL